MRVVIDTNVLFSGIFWKGNPSKILAAWKTGHFDIVVTDVVFEEYRRVLEDVADNYPEIDISEVLATIGSKALWVVAPSILEPICDDPTDDKFIAAALAGNAEVIVTGDKALLRLKTFGSVHIVTPGEFVRMQGII